MPFEFDDGFDPVRPDLWRGDPAEWDRRANAYLAAKLRERRERLAAMNIVAEAANDLDVMLAGVAGDSGTCTPDGTLEMDSEREALIESIRQAQRKDIRTGLGEL